MAENQNDVVLKPNEYAYVLDDTKGQISCLVGPYKTSLSASDSLVRLNEDTKRFEKTPLAQAIATFVTAPENWYVALKNPVKNGDHPKEGMSNTLPELLIGKKVNIKGNVSFALFPGQMAKVIKGHSLRSNQYLLVRAYDSVSVDNKTYKVGQLLIIKGTDVSFYIPPTGLEVIPDENGEYVRNAVTLESLEYCVLKSEQGEKKYIHGPAIVFPEPNEVFVPNGDSYKFRAFELSDISGVYIKVISAYDEGGDEIVGYKDIIEEQEDEEGNVIEVVTGQNPIYSDVIHHNVGEELFFTGKNMMIYYPRPEHAIIGYEGNVLHHAIAIPAGEGRYVLNRLTGDIKMIVGPLMYLPDPRYEVIVKRKLTRKQCDIWYPGNKEVLKYNENTDDVDEILNVCTDNLLNSNIMSNFLEVGGFAIQTDDDVNVQPDFNRRNTYTKPRTITIDNKFDGVVTIEVWAGYAVSVLSKHGKRRVVIGPKTVLLEYDEVLEEVDGDVYLKIDNYSFWDVFDVKTKDFADLDIRVEYTGNFDISKSSHWFDICGFKEYVILNGMNSIKKEVAKYTITEFFNNYNEIVSGAVIPSKKSEFLPNGFCFTNVNVEVITKNSPYSDDIMDYHSEVLRRKMELAKAEEVAVITARLSELRKIQDQNDFEENKLGLELQKQIQLMQAQKNFEVEEAEEKTEALKYDFDKQREVLRSEKEQIVLQRKRDSFAEEYEEQSSLAELQIKTQEAKTNSIVKTVESISPDLVAAIMTAASTETLKSVSENLSPWALASDGESVSDVINKLLRGTSLEGLVEKIIKN